MNSGSFINKSILWWLKIAPVRTGLYTFLSCGQSGRLVSSGWPQLLWI